MPAFETIGGLLPLHIGSVAQVELLSLLGTGTYGRVWHCRDPETQQCYALKVITGIRPNSYLAAKVQQEASVQIHSPYVVPALGCCQWDPSTYMLLFEFVAGSPLHQRLSQQPSGSLKHQWFMQILSGVEQAHHQQIIHRDLKPSNILIDEQDHVRIIDFGMAKFKADKTVTATGVAIGTPAYMAPEVIVQGGQVADPRADIYSLGQILYEMTTGRPFWARKGWRGMEDFLVYLAQTPAPLSCMDLNGFDCPWLTNAATVLMGMTRTQPRHRYASIAAVRQDLTAPIRGLRCPYLWQDQDPQTLRVVHLDTQDSWSFHPVDFRGSPVGSEHVVFSQRQGQYWVANASGTVLLGDHLLTEEPRPIHHGDTLSWGSLTLHFRFPPDFHQGRPASPALDQH